MRNRLVTPERIALLKKHVRARGSLPSFRELVRLLDCSSPNTATRFYSALEKLGYIRRERIGGTLTERETLLPSALLTGLPCYESIAAGWPSPAEDELCDIITLDEYLIGPRESAFLVKVTGDSMTGAGIMPGDLVIVDRGANPKPGDIVVAQVDGEWTLKYFIKETTRGKRVTLLRGANPKYPDIHPEAELVIGGVVVGSVRKYSNAR
ncbi:MAG: LexA family transcriptional regulator [Candidatus Hydrogenedentota bacterium]